jgi:hypothetical protein
VAAFGPGKEEKKKEKKNVERVAAVVVGDCLAGGLRRSGREAGIGTVCVKGEWHGE